MANSAFFKAVKKGLTVDTANGTMAISEVINLSAEEIQAIATPYEQKVNAQNGTTSKFVLPSKKGETNDKVIVDALLEVFEDKLADVKAAEDKIEAQRTIEAIEAIEAQKRQEDLLKATPEKLAKLKEEALAKLSE